MRMRLAWFSGFAVAVIAGISGARPAPAQQPAGQVVRLGDGQTLTISGLISSTLFLNNGRFGGFGQGQNAAWADSTQPATDKTFLDADVRNTRINFTLNAQPVLGKFAPRAVLEADFFGAFNGAPPFGDEQAQLRIRFAYVDLTNGRTTLRIGQYWSPLFGAVPVSLSHIAFPLTYGAAGKVGWRFPGVFLYHDLTPGKPVAIQLQLAAFEGSGPTAGAATGVDARNNIGHGEASGKPQLEALLNFSKRSPKLSWNLYVVGHVDWKDTTGTGVAGDDLTGTAFEVGGSINPNKLTVQGNVYVGKAIGQQFGHITQQGNVRGVGGWVQGGYDFTPRWSLWALYGIDDPDEAESPGLPAANARLKNEQMAGMLRFRAGRYALGLEVLRANTTWRPTVAAAGVETDATQIALSVLYTF